MPKRIGFLKELVLTKENCVRAVLDGTANLRKTPKVRRIRANAEKYGEKVLHALINGWKPKPLREKTINEGTNNKVRNLKIPCTFDHICHVAIMRPIIPILIKRFDYYCCGSVPNRGQQHANNAIKGWMKSKYKYAAEADIHHAYQNIRHIDVMNALRRFIKDKEYLIWHQMILDQMGEGLAIGFQPSHWYFNLVMTRGDRIIRNHCRKIKMVRYMDNYVFVSNRKRSLHKAIRILKTELSRMSLQLNHSWQVFKVICRPIAFLSYKYYYDFTVLRKATMYKITRSIKRLLNNICAHNCRSAISLFGLLKHCNSYNYKNKYIYNNLSIAKIKEVISVADRKCNIRQVA